MKRIHYFQHVSFEGLGLIRDWCNARGYYISDTAFYDQNFRLPSIDDYDALVVMGGPMGIYDEIQYPWLEQEKIHIKAAIDAGKHVLGVCLGAQLIASVLQAQVKPHNHKEIGWFPITLCDKAVEHPIVTNLNTTMLAFHWHGDRFEIPRGSLHLFSSNGCDNQAFLYRNKVLGLQFHLEMNQATVQKIVEACEHELQPGAYVQDKKTILNKTKKINTQAAVNTLLDNWIST